MSLIGDALSHAVLPGAAIGYLISGLSLVAMGIGGLIAGLAVALLSGAVSRYTPLKEDASFAGFYLGSLALGVTLVSLRGSSVDLLHVLFGSLLAVDNPALLLVGAIAAFTLLMLAIIYRPLVIDAFDPDFLRAQGKWSAPLVHGLFLMLVVLNLVAGFQVLGTLMSVGLMMLPAASARFWSRHLAWMLATAMALAIAAAAIGLMLSWRFSLPAGPAVVLSAALLFFSFHSGRTMRRHFAPPLNRGIYEDVIIEHGDRRAADQPVIHGENRECCRQLYRTGGYRKAGGGASTLT
ncbi:metal ABC transporter permease [Pantoea tagorei]